MEFQHGLLLSHEAFARVPEQNKPVFIYDWLRSLDRRLSQSTITDVKNVQQSLADQLMVQVTQGVGPPSRILLGRCLAKIFATGDSISLYAVLNSCNDIVRNRDDCPSTTNQRLTALTCLGIIYESLGRLCGRSFEETIGLLTKMLKHVESQMRCEILTTLGRIVTGFGATEAPCFRDVFKVAKYFVNDRVLSVRLAAVHCHNNLAQYHPGFYLTDLDAVMSMCMKGLDGSNHSVRIEIAKLLGCVLCKTQIDVPGAGCAGPTVAGIPSTNGMPNQIISGKGKVVSLDDVLGLLSSAFIRGPGRFHKGASASDMLKGTTSVSREVRVGISYAYVEFLTKMGSDWLVMNSMTVISHTLSLLANPRSSQTPNEAAFSRLCVGDYILSSLLRRHFSEAAQIVAARHLVQLIGLRHRDHQQSSGGGGRKSSNGSTRQQPDSGTTSEDAGFAGGDDLHYLTCCLGLLTQLILWLDSSIAQLISSSNFMDALFDVCVPHASLGVRVSAAAVLRQLAIALPGLRVSLMNRCMNLLSLSVDQGQSTSFPPEIISGHSLALGGLLVGVRLGDLGIPYAMAKNVFSLAEDLVRAANQNSRLTEVRTQASWYLLVACMALGPTAVRPHVPRLALLWKNAFPRSSRELESEKQRGDAFTWQITLEARAGALCSMQAFLEYCAPAMVSENVTRFLLPPLESAINLLGQMPDIVRSFGNHLSQPATIVRLRLYRCLALLPPTAYAGGFNVLLRELVAEFALTDNNLSTTVSLTSLLGKIEDNNVLLGSCLQDSDEAVLEDGIGQYNYCCPGSLANDVAYLLLPEGLKSALSTDAATLDYAHKFLLGGLVETASETGTSRNQSSYRTLQLSHEGLSSTLLSSTSRLCGPPTFAYLVIQASIDLFGVIFPYVSVRHRIQMLEHFADCIRVSKGARHEAIQVNIFAALLGALRHLGDTKYSFGDDPNLRSTAVSLAMNALSTPNPLLRSFAADCIGHLAQAVGEPGFLSELAQSCFEQLRFTRDTQTKAGLCAAIGCLHRFVGGLACGQHLGTSVGVLLAVAQDSSAPIIQTWALNALALTAESGGPMFREFVQPSLNLVLRLLLKTSFTSEIHFSLGHLLGALITALGPDIQSSTGTPSSNMGLSCLLCCSILLEHPDPLVHAEGITNFQRIHVFAPHLINLNLFAPLVFGCLTSRCFALRRAAVACIRQICQKDADRVCEVATAIPNTSAPATAGGVLFSNRPDDRFTNPPLEATFFSLADVETDSPMRRNIEECISSLLLARGVSHFPSWLNTLKQLLQVSTSELSSEIGGESGRSKSALPSQRQCKGNTEEEVEKYSQDLADDDDDDERAFGVPVTSCDERLCGSGGSSRGIFNRPPRWPTRALAIACLRRLIFLCHEAYQQASTATGSRSVCAKSTLQSPSPDYSAKAHFDLLLARKLRSGVTDAPWLVLHLGDLVQMTFVAATSSCDHLRLFGLHALKDLIHCFAHVRDPDSKGSYLLEQFKAQISAALRPAFKIPDESSTEAAPDITAAACEVSACWLTSGVPRDVADVRRVYELLNTSLEILRSSSTPSEVFSEASMTRLKLAVLVGWAEVFIASARARESSLQAIQLLSMLESSGQAETSNAIQPQFILLLTGGGGWGKPSIDDASDFLEALENEDEVDENDFGVVEEDDALNCSISDCDQKKKRFIQKLRHTVNESRHSYQLLSRLISPDLPELSSDWLAALRDFALLNLPDELAFQRPTTAGAFYNTQTDIEQVRLFYTRSWLTLLEATTLCLNTETTSKSLRTCVPLISGREDETDKQTVIPITRDCFFLVLGLAMETLCDMTKVSTPVVSTCLRVIELLIANPQSRPHLFTSSPHIPVDIMSVLHRVILTRDSTSLHLASLRVLHLIISSAFEKFRSDVTADVSTKSRSPSGRENDEVGEIQASDQTIEEFLAYLVCPSVEIIDAFLKALELTDGGPRSCFNSNGDVDHPERGLTLTALQVIVCLLARYHPSILVLPDLQSPSNVPSTFPKSPVCRDPKAPVILASAVQALTALLRICSPLVLSASEGQTVSGVLAVMCRMVSRTVQLELLETQQPHGKSNGTRSLNPPTDNQHSDSVSQTCAVEDTFTSASVDLSSPQLTRAGSETDIASIGWGNLPCSNDPFPSACFSEATAFAVDFRPSLRGLTAKLGWSAARACLADAFVCFLATVAQHRCYSTISGTAFARSSSGPLGLPLDDVTEHPADDTVTSSTAGLASVKRRPLAVALQSHPPPQIVDAPACDWHQLVIACVLTLLQHGHSTEPCGDELGEAARCCMVAAFLSTRIISASPLSVFRCQAVEFGVFDLLTRLWKDTTPASGGVDTSHLQPFNGPVTRSVCLTAIELLVNHHDADVSSCCVKTLMPLVFHWLYELSVVIATHPPKINNIKETLTDSSDPCSSVQGVLLHPLEESIDAAIKLSMNVVDIAEPSGRQNLLIILLPLFCDLLQSPDLVAELSSTAFRRAVHSLALRSILALGSRYPAEFRHVVAKVGSIKPRIEAAVRASQSSSTPTALPLSTVPSQAYSSSSSSAAVITLKTEFSNFN